MGFKPEYQQFPAILLDHGLTTEICGFLIDILLSFALKKCGQEPVWITKRYQTTTCCTVSGGKSR
jgi:hypothetical protein